MKYVLKNEEKKPPLINFDIPLKANELLMN